MAEREGFEPPVPFDITSFQDWRLQPLGHLSILKWQMHFKMPIQYSNKAADCQPRFLKSLCICI
jgi:hypothetical protein